MAPSKARQAKTEHMEMKILQPSFGILVVLTKNELTKICNELGIKEPQFWLTVKKQQKSTCCFSNFRTKTTTMTRKMVGSWKPFPVPRVQYFAWTGVSVQKVVTVEKSVMKVEHFGAITRLDKVFFD